MAIVPPEGACQRIMTSIPYQVAGQEDTGKKFVVQLNDILAGL